MFVLEPTSVALIGASAEEKKLGHYILTNLLDGYQGKVYPINPKHDELLGIKCYPSVEDIPGTVDMAIIVTPASSVTALAETCGKKNVKTLVIISAGFGEMGTEEGRKREEELRAVGKRHDMSIVGPNCLGVLRPKIRLNASFATTPKNAGNIAFISQSGAMAVALLDAASAEKLDFSFIASIGNKVCEDESSFLEVCERDSETTVIGLYLESILDGDRFVEIAKRVGKKKPIVLMKAGVSARGAKAVSSHTGALAGSSSALKAACLEAGIHLAKDTREFLSMLSTLRSSPVLATRSVAIITNAGGPGVLATDASERCGLELATLNKKTVDTLKSGLPPAASTANPVDVLGDALADRYELALQACAADPAVDGLCVLLTPQVMTPSDDVARAIIEAKKLHPLLPIVTSFMGGAHVVAARDILRTAHIPCFETPEEAAGSLAQLLASESPLPLEENDDDDDRSSAASQLLKKHHGLLPEEITEELFSLYGLPMPMQAVATNAREAVALAKSIGYPVIAKVSSPDILHKTDIGGVRADLTTDAEVQKAYADIVSNCSKHRPSAAIHGVLIQKFLPVGNEFIVGGLQDPSFGPLVMVGLGGIYAELFRDTSFRLAPVGTLEAHRMLSELKAWKLLMGMRGKGILKIDSLADIVCRISRMLADCRRISEIDLNPVLVGTDAVVIADAKVIVR